MFVLYKWNQEFLLRNIYIYPIKEIHTVLESLVIWLCKKINIAHYDIIEIDTVSYVSAYQYYYYYYYSK